MDDIAIGRKEIMKALRVDSWRTIQAWKKGDTGFSKIIHKHPINHRPFIVISETVKWMVTFNQIKNK